MVEAVVGAAGAGGADGAGDSEGAGTGVEGLFSPPPELPFSPLPFLA